MKDAQELISDIFTFPGPVTARALIYYLDLELPGLKGKPARRSAERSSATARRSLRPSSPATRTRVTLSHTAEPPTTNPGLQFEAPLGLNKIDRSHSEFVNMLRYSQLS